ncbi:MAG: right-handed parallel beta-helix repeat-containing protein [Bacteriovoracaceae bacterium]
MKLLFPLLFLVPLQAFASLCGTAVTKNLTLKEDLNCPNEKNSVLTVTKKGITINGNGFKIIAPQAETAIRLLESNITIKNIDLSGEGVGRGIEIYNAKKAVLENLTIHHRRIGIDVFFDHKSCDYLTAIGNKVTGSEVFALRINAPDCAGSRKIQNNDFYDSKDFAIYIKAKYVSINGLSGNRIDYSRNGFFLSGKKVKVRNLDLSQSEILENPLYISQTDKVSIKNVNVSTQTHAGIGLHIYDTRIVHICQLKASGQAIGFKYAGESARLKSLKMSKSNVDENGLGILLTGYSGAYLDLLFLEKVSLKGNSSPLTVSLGIVKKVLRQVQL